MSNLQQPFCQSCGMPLTKAEEFGTNADGSKNEDYCVYCFKDGAFTSNQTMDEMIALCAKFMVEANPGMTTEQAVAQMKTHFPKLKRWAAQ